MTIPAGFPYPLKQEVEIPLEQIIPNPDQPRRSIRQDSLEELAASMKVKGQEVPAPVRPLTEAERVANPGALVMLIGGHRRRLAALMNQFKTLKCTVRDIPSEETHSAAVTDNLHEEMDWWDWDLAIEKEAQLTQKSQSELEGWMGKSESKIYRAFTITKALNETARALVDENLEKTLKNEPSPRRSKNKAFLITETHLLILAGLEDPDQVHQALQVVLDDYLTPDQTKKLVAPMSPKTASSPTAKTIGDESGISSPSPNGDRPPSQRLKPATPNSELPTPHLKPPTAAPPATSSMGTVAPSSTLGTGANNDNGLNNVPLSQPSHVARPKASQQVKPSASPGQLGTVETLTWDVLLGISVLTKIKAKVKKGERPSFGEALLLAVDKLVHLVIDLVRWLAKNGIRGIFRVIKWVWHTFIESLKITGLYPLFRAICFLAFLLFAIWFGWMGYHYGWMKPVKIIGSKIPLVSWLVAPSQNQTANVAPSPSPRRLPPPVTTPVPTVVEALVSTPTVTTAPQHQAKKKSTPVIAVNVQPTATPQVTPVKKADVADDVLRAAPAGVDVAKKLFGL